MPFMPRPGNPDHEDFVRRAAANPASMEARVFQAAVDDAQRQAQDHVRTMLNQMIDLVPGQLFRDIERFHEKFGLAPTDSPGHEVPADLLKFRVKFLYEELGEYVEAVGGSYCCPEIDIDPSKYDAEAAFDALIDLVYVALGTAYMSRFPFNAGWDRVQDANMSKVRAVGDADPLSTRKNRNDVVKPPGWKPASLADLLDEACPDCAGYGAKPVAGDEDVGECRTCEGTGRRRRGSTK